MRRVPTGVVLAAAWLVSTGCSTTEECRTDADCDDGVWCNGDEICIPAYMMGTMCTTGMARCGVPGDPYYQYEEVIGKLCNEQERVCVTDLDECDTDADCDDGLFCNGMEMCLGGQVCMNMPGTSPCEGWSLSLVCVEADDECVNRPESD